MGYFFVDRILEVRAPGQGQGPPGGRGVKVVGRGERFLRPGPAGPELAGSFLGEAVGQLAAWVAMSSAGFRRRPVAGLTTEALAAGPARPGDRVDLEVWIDSLEEDALHYHGEARVRGRVLLELRHALGPMLPMEGFDDPEAVEREFRALLRPGAEEEAEEERDGVPAAPDTPGAAAAPAGGCGPGLEHPAIDQILERGPERIVAMTCVSRSAPYLEGHFPRDPVLPATLLLDAQITLGAQLVASAASLPAGTPPRPVRMTGFKMRDFVRPGARLISEVRLRGLEGGRATIQATGRVASRIVSRVSAELLVEGEAPR